MVRILRPLSRVELPNIFAYTTRVKLRGERPESIWPDRSRSSKVLGAHEKSPCSTRSKGFWIKPGDTYFHAFGTIIGSKSLTTVFGMGTGVTFPIWSPEETAGAMKLASPG